MKIGTRFGIEVCLRGGIPKITLKITGLHEILGRDYGTEEPYWKPSREVLTYFAFYKNV